MTCPLLRDTNETESIEQAERFSDGEIIQLILGSRSRRPLLRTLMERISPEGSQAGNTAGARASQSRDKKEKPPVTVPARGSSAKRLPAEGERDEEEGEPDSRTRAAKRKKKVFHKSDGGGGDGLRPRRPGDVPQQICDDARLTTMARERLRRVQLSNEPKCRTPLSGAPPLMLVNNIQVCCFDPLLGREMSATGYVCPQYACNFAWV